MLEAQRVEADSVRRKDIARQVFEMETAQVRRVPFAMSNKIQDYSSRLHNFVYHQNLVPDTLLDNMLDYLWVGH